MSDVLKRVGRGLREHTYLAIVSAGVIAAALLLIGLFAMVTTNLRGLLGAWERDVHVSVYFRPALSAEEHAAAVQALSERPEVASAQYVSQAEASAWMRERMPELGPVLGQLGDDTLPASVEVTLRAGSTSSAALSTFVGSIRSNAAFDDVDYGEEWVNRIDTFLSVFRVIGVGLGTFIAIAALFLVGNTIHLVVYARRDELEIMRLVGATDRYILGPFLIEGAMQGALGAALATGALWAAHAALHSRLHDVLSLALGAEGLLFLPVSGIAGLIAGGVLLGLVASWVAVRRFLGRLP